MLNNHTNQLLNLQFVFSLRGAVLSNFEVKKFDAASHPTLVFLSRKKRDAFKGTVLEEVLHTLGDLCIIK